MLTNALACVKILQYNGRSSEIPSCRERTVGASSHLASWSVTACNSERTVVGSSPSAPRLIRLRRVFALRCNEGASFCRAPNLGGTTIIRPEECFTKHSSGFFLRGINRALLRCRSTHSNRRMRIRLHLVCSLTPRTASISAHEDTSTYHVIKSF